MFSSQMVGCFERLTELANRCGFVDLKWTVAIVQPGVSVARMADPQFELLGCVEIARSDAYAAKLGVLCSE